MSRLDPISIVADENAQLPELELPGPNRLVGEVASELAEILNANPDAKLYRRDQIIVTPLDHCKTLMQMTGSCFCSWVESFVTPVIKVGEQVTGVPATLKQSMDIRIANQILASLSFWPQLPEIERCYAVPSPMKRHDNSIEFLECGYDAASKTYVYPLGTEENAETEEYTLLPLDAAVQYLRNMFAQFPFSDWDTQTMQCRSLAITVAAMLTQFAPGLIPKGANRLGFFFNANASRSGKTLLAKMALIPAHGIAQIKAFPKRPEELEKLIDSSVLAGASYLLLDNVKKHLDNDVLEALMTSSYWTGRVMGGNTMFSAPNELTLLVTANNATCSTDLANRFLISDLFVEEANVQERKVTEPLEDNTLMSMPWRHAALSCLHSLVHHWVEAGRPMTGGQQRNGFESWCSTYASIIYFSGLGDCLEPTPMEDVGDTETDEIRALVQLLWAEMHGEGLRRKEFLFQEIVDLCYHHELLAWQIKDGKAEVENEGGEMVTHYKLKQGARSVFGRYLVKWFPSQSNQQRKRRYTLNEQTAVRAFCAGKDRTRKYVIEAITN